MTKRSIPEWDNGAIPVAIAIVVAGLMAIWWFFSDIYPLDMYPKMGRVWSHIFYEVKNEQ